MILNGCYGAFLMCLLSILFGEINWIRFCFLDMPFVMFECAISAYYLTKKPYKFKTRNDKLLQQMQDAPFPILFIDYFGFEYSAWLNRKTLSIYDSSFHILMEKLNLITDERINSILAGEFIEGSDKYFRLTRDLLLQFAKNTDSYSIFFKEDWKYNITSID